MAATSDQAWREVELPCIVRYRTNGFTVHFMVSGALLLASVACISGFGSLVAGLPFAIMGGMGLILTIVPLRHVREMDYMRIDVDALTLVAKDGNAVRIPFSTGTEFSVAYEQCCRSIVMTSVDDNHWEKEHVIADMLDVPRELTIYGLCQLMNDLCKGYVRRRVGPWQGAATVRRRQDWFRGPPRLSRLMFLASMLALGALFLCVLFVVTLATSSLDWLVAKPIFFAVRFGVSVLFTYPALRFLLVARLRDLGEAAHHGNAMGLVWNRSVGGPWRVILRRGQQGRNDFGPEPRF
jgi:hypothetical protein